MTPVIVHQEENYAQDLHWDISTYFLVHHVPLGYIYRGGWMKAMSLFSRTCVDSKLSSQVLLFDVHDSHFDYRATHII